MGIVTAVQRLRHMAFVVFVVPCVFGPIGARSAEPDPYAPLKLYDGQWLMTTSDGKSVALANHCARTGLFFACEQVVDGRPADLVVFLPQARTAAAGQTYRTQALMADGAGVHSWHTLIIDGDRWTYLGDEPTPGAGVRDRTLNTFAGSDHIHFETQTSADGKTWTTTSGGDERRTR